MKKALAILSALALVGSVAFAEAGVKVGAWGRGIFAFAGDSTKDATDPSATATAGTVAGTSWGSDIRTGFTIAGNSDNVGFQIDVNVDGAVPGRGDNANIWVKPVDGLTFKLGQTKEDTLRGNGTFGSFNWIRTIGEGEDLTFTRIAADKGLVGTYTGVENLYVGFKLESGYTVAKAFEYGQYAIGYTIPSIGQIRAQYIGKTSTTSVPTDLGSGVVNAAFKLTAVENLYVDVGTFLSLKTTSKLTVDLNPIVAAYGSYKLDALTLHLLAKAQIFTGDTAKPMPGVELNPLLIAGVGADYDLGDGLAVSADVRAADLLDVAKAKENNVNNKIGVFAGLSKSFSNGKIGIGFEFMSKNKFDGGLSYSNLAITSPGTEGTSAYYDNMKKASWAIPVLFEYSF